MPKYHVNIEYSYPVWVTFREVIEAESEEEAIQKGHEELDALDDLLLNIERAEDLRKTYGTRDYYSEFAREVT